MIDIINKSNIVEKIKKKYWNKEIETYNYFEKKKEEVFKERNRILKKIPGFWCKALRSCDELSPFFSDVDTVRAMESCYSLFFESLEGSRRGLKIKMVLFFICFSL